MCVCACGCVCVCVYVGVWGCDNEFQQYHELSRAEHLVCITCSAIFKFIIMIWFHEVSMST